MSGLDVLIQQAVAAEESGQPDEARRLLLQIVADWPGEAEPLRLLSEQAGRRGEYDEAIRLGVEVYRLAPTNALPPFRVAEWLTHLGRYEDAVPWFRNAMAANPGWLDVEEILGRNLWFCHRLDEARDHWRHWRQQQRQAAMEAGQDPDAYRILGPNWTGWLGNNAHLDPYLKLRALGRVPPTPLKVLAPPGRVANAHFLGYFEPYCEIIRDSAACTRLEAQIPLLGDPLHMWFVDAETPSYYLPAMAVAQSAWDAEGRAPLLRLRDDDRRRGAAVLRRFGLDADDWFVCLHVREAGFWRETGEPWNAPRMAPIADYLDAVRRIVDAGGWVIRMGDASMTPLPGMHHVIDYARSDLKADWMDVFLTASCRFLLGTNSALYWVAAAFGVPAVLTNWLPITAPALRGADIIVPKLLRDIRTGRLLDFESTLRLPRDTWSGHFFRETGLEIVDNTAGEISAAVDEMLNRGERAAASRREAALLVARFDAIRAAVAVPGNGAISGDFLKAHEDLL